MRFLPQRHVEKHHQGKAEGGTDGTDIAVLAHLRLGDKFLNDDVNHCAGGKGEDIGENGGY